jgi:hypothetical protein
MDWDLAIEKEREKLKRIVALFYALAVLADRICSRSRPLRCFVLWIMRPAMEIALDCIADAGPVPEALLQESIDSMAEARRYSRCFRTAARSMKGLLKALDRCEAYEEAYSMGFNATRLFRSFVRPPFHRQHLLASLNNLASAITGRLRFTLASTLLLPEPCDTS